MPTHNFFVSKPIIKSPRRCDLQTVIIHCYLYAGGICQIAMAMCIDNHFTNGLYRKFISLFPDQSLNPCPQADIAQDKCRCLLNLFIDRSCKFPLIKKNGSFCSLK